MKNTELQSFVDNDRHGISEICIEKGKLECYDKSRV